MTETGWIAIAFIAGTFGIIALALHKENVDAALKIWGGIGSVTGVVIGGISGYYFTNEANQNKIGKLQAENKVVKLVLNKAIADASDANKVVSPFTAALKGEGKLYWLPSSTMRAVASLPESERGQIIQKFGFASNKLKSIENLEATIQTKPVVKDGG